MLQARVTIIEPLRNESSENFQVSISDNAIDVPSTEMQRKPSVIDDDYVFDEDESDSGDSESSVGSFVWQNEFTREVDFFDQLGEIPEIDDISLDLSDEMDKLKSIHTLASEETMAKTDVGQFVNPLTGEIISTESTAETVVEVCEEAEVEADEYSDDWLWEIDIEVDDTDLLQKKLSEERAYVLEAFFDPEGKQVKIEDEVDFEAYERAELARLLNLTTLEFLSELIESVVDQSEYVDPNAMLRQRVDKVKLMKEFQRKFGELDIERRMCSFLNRKSVEYFRRKKAFRVLMGDNVETVAQDQQKYKEAIYKLDQQLGKETQMRKVTEARIGALKSDMLLMERKVNDEITSFENLVRKSLVRETFEKLSGVVENQLRKMAMLRNEISKIRLILIQKQHTLAMLMKKLEELEYLGNGLCMRDFEHLQTETQALGKKIEERNAELSKLRSRCNVDLHIMSHMKEKQQMMRYTIDAQELALIEILDEKADCRRHLYELKMERSKMRKEISELSFQGGLIDKPALMMDYDDTLDRVIKLRYNVDQLKAKFKEIQSKIRAIESKCEAN